MTSVDASWSVERTQVLLKITKNQTGGARRGKRDETSSSTQSLTWILARRRNPKTAVDHRAHVRASLVHGEGVDEFFQRVDGAGIEGFAHLAREGVVHGDRVETAGTETVF